MCWANRLIRAPLPLQLNARSCPPPSPPPPPPPPSVDKINPRLASFSPVSLFILSPVLPSSFIKFRCSSAVLCRAWSAEPGWKRRRHPCEWQQAQTGLDREERLRYEDCQGNHVAPAYPPGRPGCCQEDSSCHQQQNGSGADTKIHQRVCSTQHQYTR